MGIIQSYMEGVRMRKKAEKMIKSKQLCVQTGLPCGMPCNGDCSVTIEYLTKKEIKDKYGIEL